MDIQTLAHSILLFLMLGAFLIASYKYKGFPLVLKYVACYLLVEFISQAALYSMMRFYPKENRYFILHIAFPLEAITLLLMYREVFKKYIEDKNTYVYRKIFIILITLFVIFSIANILFWQNLSIYPSNTRTVLSIIIIILNVLYIYKYTSHEPVPRTGLELVNYQMSRLSLFWITTGLLLFHSFSLFRYIFINIFRKELSQESLKEILLVYTVFAIILFAFIVIGILKAKRIIVVDDESKVDNKQ